MTIKQLKLLIRGELVERVITHMVGDDKHPSDDDQISDKPKRSRTSKRIAGRTSWSVLPESSD
tara:strand:+ start:76789 stop:76977 length:189 start_codon:yes stop_codon:yes gene_type:complete